MQRDPGKDDASAAATTEASGGRKEDQIVAGDDAACKRRANLIAHAALAGIVVTPQADGSFLLRRWSLSREVGDVDELEQALRLQGVRL
ncbi:MAG: hypothetical protein MUE62_06325 [Burkholderiaceae bacterium]|nr:hypothetical protein [Burkholderiaceae bacterium]